MDSQEKPKRRLVTYVSEETYSQLEKISKTENRSISSITEMQIVKSLKIGEQDLNIAQSGTDQHTLDPSMINAAVVNAISNLPDKNLQILADRLSGFLARHGPAQISTRRKSLIPRKKSDVEIVKNLALRLQHFMDENKLSQRAFRDKYGADVTQITRWISGTKGMSDEKIAEFESILSSPI